MLMSPAVISLESLSHVTRLHVPCDPGYPVHRESRENGQNNSLLGKTQGIWKSYQNTGNLVCSSCKFPDSKGKRHFDSCSENFQMFFEAG